MDNQDNNVTMDIENKPVESSNSTESTTPPQQNTNLTLGLLSNVKSLVEIAIKRGAYQPNEVSTVGKVYDQYVAALGTLNQQAIQQADANKDTATNDAPEAPDAADGSN
jgi:hypothetical protein